MLESQIPIGSWEDVVCAEDRGLLVVGGFLADMKLDSVHLDQGFIMHLLLRG